MQMVTFGIGASVDANIFEPVIRNPFFVAFLCCIPSCNCNLGVRCLMWSRDTCVVKSSAVSIQWGLKIHDHGAQSNDASSETCNGCALFGKKVEKLRVGFQ